MMILPKSRSKKTVTKKIFLKFSSIETLAGVYELIHGNTQMII